MTEQQAQFEVKSVKLIRKDKDGKEFTPEIVLWDPVLKRNDTFDNCQNLAHQDFIKAISRLADHMVILWDADEPDNFERSELVEKFEARGYSIKGGGDETRITIKGHRKTRFAGAITANATIYLEQDMDDPDSYAFADDLKEKIKRINIEVLAYVFDKKTYENPQLSLSLPDPDEKITKAKVAPHVDMDPSMNSPESIAANIVAETNAKIDAAAGKGKPGRPRKVPQSAKHPSGEVHE